MIIMNDIQKKIREELANVTNSKFAHKTDRQLSAEENWKNDKALQERRTAALRENTDKISEHSKKMWEQKGFREKRKAAAAASNAKPEVKAKRKASSAKLHADPEYQAKAKAGRDALRNDPVRWAEYQKKYNKGNKAKLEDPSFWEAYYASIKIRDADPEYHKKRIDASKKKICRRVQTPLGVFDSITDAANAHGMGNTETMRNRLKSPNFPDFLLLDDVAKKPQKKKK